MALETPLLPPYLNKNMDLADQHSGAIGSPRSSNEKASRRTREEEKIWVVDSAGLGMIEWWAMIWRMASESK